MEEVLTATSVSLTSGMQIPANTFHYDWIYGGFCTWMLMLSSLMFTFYVFKQPSATVKPYIYWAIFSWTVVPLWFFSWAIWLLNLIFDNHGGTLHIILAATSVAYMIMPVLIQPVFLIIIQFGYTSKTIYRSEDPYFWWFTTALLISDAANFLVFYYTASGIQN